MWQQRQTTRQRNDINKHLSVLFPLLGGGSNLNKLSIRPFDSDTILPSAHVRSYWRNCIAEVCSDLVVASLACHFPREVFYINKYIAEGHLELFICCNHTGKGATRLFNDSKYTDSMDITIIYFKTYCYCNYYLSFFIKTSFWTKSTGLEKRPLHILDLSNHATILPIYCRTEAAGFMISLRSFMTGGGFEFSLCISIVRLRDSRAAKYPKYYRS